MKKYILIFSVAVILFGCGNNKTSEKAIIKEGSQLSVFSFKLIGLNDSVISDSIWKMIFTVEGINEMSIRKDDSTIVIKGEMPLTKASLSEEIEKRGGIIVK